MIKQIIIVIFILALLLFLFSKDVVSIILALMLLGFLIGVIIRFIADIYWWGKDKGNW